MIFRTESQRERVLLRLIEQQQRIIQDQADRIMFLADRTWTPPPPQEQEEEIVEPFLESALSGLPPGYAE